MSPASMVALAAAMLVISATPGPSDLAVVSRSITAGVAVAVSMILGIVVADYLFIVLAVYGMATVAEHYESLFQAVKYLCAVYLVWLGVASVRAQPGVSAAASPGRGHFSSFGAGLMITLGDPKAILFYMSLLPAFVDLASIGTLDILLIMLITTLVVGGVKGIYALLAERAVALLGNPGTSRLMNIAAGVVLIATGLFLGAQGLVDSIPEPGA